MSAKLLTGLAFGLALVTGLVVYFGAADVGRTIAVAGWWTLSAMVLSHLPSMALCGLAWRRAAPATAVSCTGFIAARWIRDGAGNVIAVLPISGELAGARVLTRLGMSGGAAAASVVVDVTMELLSQLLFTLLGLGVLAAHGMRGPITYCAAAGIALTTPLVAGFVIAQKSGVLRIVERLSVRLADSLQWPVLRGTAQLQAAIHAVYGSRRQIGYALVLHLAAWIAGTAETWVGLTLLGHSLHAWQIMALESLVHALRTAAFIVPSALGVQEGGYIVVGALFGLGPDVALALSLLKRGREVLLALPSLIAWQAIEGSRRSVRRCRGIEPTNSDP